jgi:protein transport protein SEC24
VRVSNGWREVISMGNLTIKQKTKDLIIGPTMDQDKAICYEIEKDDTFKPANPQNDQRRDPGHVFIQSALLYSTTSGERRIRVHNLAVPLSNQKHDCYEFIDLTALTFFFARTALNRINSKLAITRGTIEMFLGNLIKAQHRSINSMKKETPENIQYLILYVLGILKSPYLTPRTLDANQQMD